MRFVGQSLIIIFVLEFQIAIEIEIKIDHQEIMAQQLRMITIIAAWLLILLTGIYVMVTRFDQKRTDKVRIGIRLTDDGQRAIAQQFLGQRKDLSRAGYVEFTAGWKEFFALQQAGLRPELVVAVESAQLFDQGFHQLAQVDSAMEYLNQAYPMLTTLQTIGSSAFWGLPIRGIRISALRTGHQQAASLLLTAGHHANEPVGVEICLHLMNYLCRNYDIDSRVKAWLDAIEVWIVPVVNPDGYRLIFSDSLRLIWRKNLRDNNGDGRFSPDCDGVDLNRNYDYNWGVAGEHSIQSNYYCGPSPFSEPEIVAIRNLTERNAFSLHLDFHSAGEKVLYPASIIAAPKMVALAQSIAGQMKRRSGTDSYQIAPLYDLVGQCSSWMFFRKGIPSLLIEAGDSYFPSRSDLSAIVEQNAKAVFFVLDRLLDRADWAAQFQASSAENSE